MVIWAITISYIGQGALIQVMLPVIIWLRMILILYS